MTVTGASNAYAYPLNPSQVRKPVDRNSELYKACVDFEALFVKQMLDVMRKTVQKDGLLDGGVSEEVFQDMLYGEYARKMAETAQFGLSDLIYRQLSSKP